MDLISTLRYAAKAKKKKIAEAKQDEDAEGKPAQERPSSERTDEPEDSTDDGGAQRTTQSS
jgi:hypothetical protein